MHQRRVHILAGIAACAAGVALGGASTVRADVVDDWNNIWLDTVRATGGGPCPISRAGAMYSVAVFEAINSIERDYEPFLDFVRVDRPASTRAAAAVAAHDTLVHLYPARAAIFAAELADSLAAIPNGTAKTNGIAVGHRAASDCITSRDNDNSNITTPYVFGTGPGHYQLTDSFLAPHGPNFYQCDTWVINNSNYWKVAKPLGFNRMDRLLESSRYAAQFNEVKSLGARNSTTRTAEQTEIAWFWANDRDGTSKPPGQLNQAAQILAEQEGLNMLEKARLIALLNIALADTVIKVWEAKYATNIDFWRPVTGIRQAHTDGNPATAADPNWLPLLEFTPPFPAYASGHSGMGGAFAGVFAEFFGTDDITYTLITDEPIVSHVTRTFHSFSEAGFENAISRVYLGVHWRMDCEAAYAAGVRIGDHVARTQLQPLHGHGPGHGHGDWWWFWSWLFGWNW